MADLANPFALEMVLLSALPPSVLNCLLYIAGVIDFSRAADLRPGQIREHVNVNNLAPMIIARALLPTLRRARGLVPIASSTATLSAGAAGRSAYVASKFGVRSFADALRREESSQGVRVTTVFPGRTDTPMQECVHKQDEKVYDAAQLMRPRYRGPIDPACDRPANGYHHPQPHHQADASPWAR